MMLDRLPHNLGNYGQHMNDIPAAQEQPVDAASARGPAGAQSIAEAAYVRRLQLVASAMPNTQNVDLKTPRQMPLATGEKNAV